ncbi:MAG: RNA methyltransferase [Muribaculaceae bacterium]|nr:RNA methyltransferase [Muribaculaceae bacterium]MDE7394142.1 RNA methyltransferase [Muribaculaceae bacterium]
MEKKTIWDLNRPDIEQYRHSAKAPVAVVLDNVRSLNNIGSIFRTCDGLGVAELLLCGITATPPSPEIHKTALGAEDSVEWRYFPSAIEAVDYLHEKGYRVMALEQVKGSLSLPDYHPTPGELTAIVAGNEVDGVDQQVVDACDGALEIPQFGTKHSLNVAVSTALAIYQLTLLR